MTTWLARSLALGWVAAMGIANASAAGSQALPSFSPTAKGSYAILVSNGALADAGWKRAVDALQRKYDGRIFTYEYPDLFTVQDAVAAYGPRYVCLVARPSEAPRGFVKDACRFMRTLDDDPYEDAIWGILTGYDAEDALRIATTEPLEVRRGVSHVGSGWLDALEEGVSWDEGAKNRKYIKSKEKQVQQVAGPDDTTREIVEELNRGQSQVMSSSGHATEHDWQLGFSYKNGQFISRKGRLYGVSLDRQQVEIRSPNAKVYYSPGNCLIAHAADMDAMVLAWIHSGGANQFFGHVVNQYRTCWAWEVGGYFFSLQGRYSFAESVFLFHQDVIARLQENPDAQKRFFLGSDRDATVMYGDPAWQARVKAVTQPPYEQTLSIKELDGGDVRVEFGVKALKDCGPSEPAAALLPVRIRDAVIERTDAAAAFVADDFVLMRLLNEGEKPLRAADTRSVSIRAKKAQGLLRSRRIAEPVRKMEAMAMRDLPAVSRQERPIVEMKKLPGQAPPAGAELADRGGWNLDADALVHHDKAGKQDARIALAGRKPTALAWDGRYLWVAEKRLLHVIARDEVLFSIAMPELDDSTWLSIDGDELRIGNGKNETIAARVDRSIKATLGPKRSAKIEFIAELMDEGAAGLDVVDLHIAAPWNTNRQKVIGDIVLSAPGRPNTDRWGQPLFSFHGIAVAPKTPFRRSITWDAELRDMRVWVWPDRVAGALPKEIAEKYLADSRILGINTPEVKQALAKAIGGEREPYWVARRIYRYVIEHMQFERGRPWGDARGLLKEGKGSCSSYVILFVSMCRSAGLPARFAAGTRCREGNRSTDREFHRWAEVYLPGYGWVPTDPSGGDSEDPVARASAFGHVPDTDFVTTVGGGDSDYFAWQYNAQAQADVEITMRPMPALNSRAVWTRPQAAEGEGGKRPARRRDGLFNGDFDLGRMDGWHTEGPHLIELSPATRDGRGACLHIHIQEGQSCNSNIAAHPEKWAKVYRKLRMPPQASFMHFWAKVSGDRWHEPVRIFVDRGEGPKEIGAIGGGDGKGANLDWSEQFVDISAYRGMSVLLGIFAANWNGLFDHRTDIYVDDVFLCDGDRRRIEVPPLRSGPVNAALAQRIEAQIARLSDADPAERNRAQQELLDIGRPALDRLEAAAGSEDPETRSRAAAIIEPFGLRVTEQERAENQALGKGR